MIDKIQQKTPTCGRDATFGQADRDPFLPNLKKAEHLPTVLNKLSTARRRVGRGRRNITKKS